MTGKEHRGVSGVLVVSYLKLVTRLNFHFDVNC